MTGTGFFLARKLKLGASNGPEWAFTAGNSGKFWENPGKTGKKDLTENSHFW